MPLNNLKSAPAQPVNNIDEKYVAYNPTILVRPIDPVDYTNSGSGSGTGSSGVTSVWLTKNIDYTKVPESDIVLVTIPKVKLNTNYRGWIGGSSQIIIWRAAGDLKFDSTGNLIPDASTYDLGLKKISRYDVKHHIWVGVNIIWDDDWQEHENTEQFVLISHQGLFSGSILNIKGSVKIGYDSAKKKVSATATVSANFDITTRSRCILKYNNQVSRRSLLAHVVGGIGFGTYDVNGVPYTIRTADALDYYFKVNWTHVSD